MSIFAEMVAGRHAFFALLRGGEVAFNTLTIWRHCFACCLLLLLLLSISAFGVDLRVVVVRVTDVDTIVIQSGEEQYKNRLSGIDAPEIRQAFGKAEVRESKRILWQQQQAIPPKLVSHWSSLSAQLNYEDGAAIWY